MSILNTIGTFILFECDILKEYTPGTSTSWVWIISALKLYIEQLISAPNIKVSLHPGDYLKLRLILEVNRITEFGSTVRDSKMTSIMLFWAN